MKKMSVNLCCNYNNGVAIWSPFKFYIVFKEHIATVSESSIFILLEQHVHLARIPMSAIVKEMAGTTGMVCTPSRAPQRPNEAPP